MPVAQLLSVRPHHDFMEHTMTSELGISWLKLALQLATFLLVVVLPVMLAIRATIVSVRVFRGILVPVWVVVCWLLPVIGPIAALLAAKNTVEPKASHVA